MHSMPWSGDVVPVLRSCCPSTPSAAVPASSVLCHCLGLFVHPFIHKSRVNKHFHLLHASRVVELLLDFLTLSIYQGLIVEFPYLLPTADIFLLQLSPCPCFLSFLSFLSLNPVDSTTFLGCALWLQGQ